MDPTALPSRANSAIPSSTMDMVLYGENVHSLEEVIGRLRMIDNPAERYDEQLAVMGQMTSIHDAVDDTIEKFFAWVQEDRAYESIDTAEEFHEKFASAISIVEENRRRRNKLREAATEVIKRWGNEIIPALATAQGSEPTSTTLQQVRKLAGKTGLPDGILRANRAMYDRLVTRKKGVRAIKALTPGDFVKALALEGAMPLTQEELGEIGMHVCPGPIGLLHVGLAPELVGGGDMEGIDYGDDAEEGRGRQGDFKGPASEIDKAPLHTPAPDSPTRANDGMGREGTEEKAAPASSIPYDLRRRLNRRLPEVADDDWIGSDRDDDFGEGDGTPESGRQGQRKCGCSGDGRATWDRRVSKRTPVTEAAAMGLLDEMMDMRVVCFKHMRDMGGKIGLRVRHLNASELRLRLGHIFDNRNRIGDLKMANRTVQWFRRKNRPPHPADALRTYKFVAKPFEEAFDYDQPALRRWIGGIDMDAWTRDGSVNVDLFGWWWETGLSDIILSEFDMYHFHLREMNGNGNWGWLRNMYHSTGQQLMRQDPLYYALYASLRADKHWRLASYPYYAKYNKAGDPTYFRHIDINIPAALETGKGVEQIQGTVSLDDEDESQATIILAGTHLTQLGELWARICARNQQTNGFIHRFTPPMVTKEDMAAVGVEWKAVPCKKGQVRVTKPTLPHGADGPATGTRRTMLPWYVGILDDCETLEIADGGTWESLSQGHREMVGGESSPSGLPSLFGTIPYRFPAAVELTGLGPLSDALVCRLKWNSPLVLMHRNCVLTNGREGLWEYVRRWRVKAVLAAREAHQLVRQLERQAFGTRSYYYQLEQSELMGVEIPVIAEDFGPVADDDSDITDEDDVAINVADNRRPTELVFAEQGDDEIEKEESVSAEQGDDRMELGE